MPSLDEPDVAPLGDDVTPPSDDVLAVVRSEGGRRRARRHRRNAALGAIGLVALAVPALALLPDGGDDQLTVAAEREPTTTERASTTVTTAMTATTVVSTVTSLPADSTPATTVPATRRPATTVPATTIPPLVCRDTIDPACGPFYWDPAPAANQGLSASFLEAPTEAVVGQEVTFTVAWSDPDADQFSEAFSVEGVSIAGPCTIAERYGPNTPPPAQAGSGTRTYSHTFTTADVYDVRVDLFSGNVCDHPYASEGHLQVFVTVVEAPSG